MNAQPTTLHSATADLGGSPGRLAVLGAVVRRLVPNLVEATLVPTALLTVSLLVMGSTPSFLIALAWAYISVIRRLVRRRPVPALLVMASIGITVRTVFAIASGSTFVYFAQPVGAKVVLSAAFVASVLVGRPVIGRFALDFCSMTPELHARPGIVGLYRRLTYLWAGVNLASAAVTVLLLLTVPVAAYVPARTVAGWLLTVAGVIVTVFSSVRVASAEGLLATIAPDGSLSARCRGVAGQ